MTIPESVFLIVFIGLLGMITIGIVGHYLSWALGLANITAAITIGIFGYGIGRLNSKDDE